MLVELLHPERVSTQEVPNDKEDALRLIASLLVRPERAANEDIVYQVLAERERLASTGVGSEVAIPHGRFDGVDELRAAVAVCRDGVDFDAVDARPVKILVGIIGPRSMPQRHLAALAGVSRVLRDDNVRDALIRARDDVDAHRILVEA
ncbi:MAG: PTS sugar transporter subunit IIA [Myxococcota bacterium]